MNLLRAGNHMVVGDDVAFVADDCTGAFGAAVAGLHVNGHHRIGHFLRHRAPVRGLTGFGFRRTGSGRVGLHAGQ